MTSKNHELVTRKVLIMKKKSMFLINQITFIISLSVFFYVFLRASLLTFTIDESLSYLYYLESSFKNIFFPIGMPYKANNHQLNTVLMQLSSFIFGDYKLPLRLPNILAYILYAFSTYQIIKNFKIYIAITGFIILTVNPYLLDFFSVARGYGLELAFMLLSFSYLINGFLAKKSAQVSRNLLIALFWAGIGTFANLTLWYYNIALCLTIVFGLYLRRLLGLKTSQNFSYYVEVQKIPKYFTQILKEDKLLVLMNALSFLYLVPYTATMQIRGEFNAGGEDGFWHGTVISLIKSYLYGNFYSDSLVAVILIAIILVFLNSILVFYNYFNKNSKINFNCAYVPLIIFFINLACVFVIVLLHKFGANYPTERTALFLIPLFFCLLIYTLNCLSRLSVRGFGNLLSKILSILFVGMITFHTFHSFNIKYIYDWKHHADTEEMLTDLNTITKGKLTYLGVTRTFYPPIQYYIETRKELDWLKVDWFQKKSLNHYDYFYSMPNSSMPNNPPLTNLDSILVKKYHITGNILSLNCSNPNKIKECEEIKK